MWEELNKEAVELFQRGDYAGAEEIGKKALLEAEESETEANIRANYTFDLAHDGSTVPLIGEGLYQWTKIGPDYWMEGARLTLAAPEGIGTCTINYMQEYSAKAGAYRIKTIRSTSSTLEGLSGSTVTSILTSTPTSVGVPLV